MTRMIWVLRKISPKHCAFFVFFVAILVVWVKIPFARSEDSFDHGKWDRVLKEFVHAGRVDYARLRKNRELLDRYLDDVEALSLDRAEIFGREERLALWINLYNASVIRTILDHPPVKSIEEIKNVWNERTVRMLGDRFSLSEIRDEIIRRGFRDERILTALVSGRMDSPQLLGRAFHGASLDSDLDETASRFVDDTAFNRIIPDRKKIFLSPLFHVFENDFLLNFANPEANGKFSERESAVISFILHCSKDAQKRLFLYGGKYKISYLAADARLNDAVS